MAHSSLALYHPYMFQPGDETSLAFLTVSIITFFFAVDFWKLIVAAFQDADDVLTPTYVSRILKERPTDGKLSSVWYVP